MITTASGAHDDDRTRWVPSAAGTHERRADEEWLREYDQYAAAELKRRHERTEQMIRKAHEQFS